MMLIYYDIEIKLIKTWFKCNLRITKIKEIIDVDPNEKSINIKAEFLL